MWNEVFWNMFLFLPTVFGQKKIKLISSKLEKAETFSNFTIFKFFEPLKFSFDYLFSLTKIFQPKSIG